MSEPGNKLPKVPPPPPRVPGTGPRLTQALAPPSPPLVIEAHHTPAPSVPPPSGASRLKLVTIAPGHASFPDAELPTSERLALRADPYLGATIDGRYKVEALLGEGGMGVVYRCSHTIIGKKVAMKVLRADLARDTEVTERFLNEAKSASSIGNPHIIDISDFGQFADGSTYFVMEFLSGIPLSTALEGGNPMPIPRILTISMQLAEALLAAHEAGIVHRDLKPDNIFLIDRSGQKDFVKILDFGIAKVSTTGEGKLTRAGAVFGTPHYMAPEQAAGAPVDHRGDIYSLGVILYEMASGRVPFDADNFMGILTQHMYKAPVPIRALLPELQEVPPGLEAIVLKCLSKRPEDRYQAMGDLLVELEALKAGQVPAAVDEMMARTGGFNVPADYFNRGPMPAPLPATPPGTSRKNPWPWLAGSFGILAAVGILLFMLAKSNKEHAPLESVPQPAGLAHAPAALSPAAAPPLLAPEPSAHRAPAGKRVVLAVEPLDAHVFRGDTDLGASPVMLDVPEGQRLELEVRHPGFKSLPVSVDGSEPRKVVQLERLGRPAVYKAPAKAKVIEKPNATGQNKKAIGGGEIVNPWDR